MTKYVGMSRKNAWNFIVKNEEVHLNISFVPFFRLLSPRGERRRKKGTKFF